MAREKILIVDDEQDIVDAITFQLKRDGFRVCAAHDGNQALAMTRAEHPDVIVLDLMLPEVDGLEVCRILRGETATQQTPILMLTAKTQEADRIVGLELGADDYITKPFSVRELIARIKAVLRRTAGEDAAECITLGPLRVDLGRHVVTLHRAPIEVTTKEFGLLVALLKAKGRVMTREQLLERVWGYDHSTDIESRTVDLHVSQLRRKLGEAGRQIVTVKGVGYRLERAS